MYEMGCYIILRPKCKGIEIEVLLEKVIIDLKAAEFVLNKEFVRADQTPMVV